ncbi:MAG: hypothetical protein ACLTS6_16925 [Anaerobutyricum sp.]
MRRFPQLDYASRAEDLCTFCAKRLHSELIRGSDDKNRGIIRRKVIQGLLSLSNRTFGTDLLRTCLDFGKKKVQIALTKKI